MAKVEYNEGIEAAAKFRAVASALFQVPKNGRKRENRKRQPKKATSRESHGSDKG